MISKKKAGKCYILFSMHAVLRFPVPVHCSPFNSCFPCLPVLFGQYSSADFLPWLQGQLLVLPALALPFAIPCPASLPQLFPSTAHMVSVPTPSFARWLLEGAGVW